MSAEKNELQDEGFAIALTRLAGPNRGERERRRERERERERERGREGERERELEAGHTYVILHQCCGYGNQALHSLISPTHLYGGLEEYRASIFW